MKTYWDTSALINAAISPEVMARLDQGVHVTRLHTLGEFFSTMTGRGVPVEDADGMPARFKLTPTECAALLRQFAGRFTWVELSAGELLDALDAAQKLGVQGAHVYDYWHALVAGKSKADELLTRNAADFTGLAENLAWP